MNAHISDFAAADDLTAATARPGGAQRHDGWTPERQCVFIRAISAGHSVNAACCAVGMSVSSVYAFRRTPAGEVFWLGWQAANILARDAIRDRLIARALDGFEETVTRPNGEVLKRHRYDNRLAIAVLATLDRNAKPYGPDDFEAARLVSRELDPYMELVEREAGPAAAAEFVGERLARPYEDAVAQPLRALERAAARSQAPGEAPAPGPPEPAAGEGDANADETCHSPPFVPLCPAEDEAAASGRDSPRLGEHHQLCSPENVHGPVVASGRAAEPGCWPGQPSGADDCRT